MYFTPTRKPSIHSGSLYISPGCMLMGSSLDAKWTTWHPRRGCSVGVRLQEPDHTALSTPLPVVLSALIPGDRRAFDWTDLKSDYSAAELLSGRAVCHKSDDSVQNEERDDEEKCNYLHIMSSEAPRLAEARTSSVKDERNVQLFFKGTLTGNNCKSVINLGDFNVLDTKLKTRKMQCEWNQHLWLKEAF